MSYRKKLENCRIGFAGQTPNIGTNSNWSRYGVNIVIEFRRFFLCLHRQFVTHKKEMRFRELDLVSVWKARQKIYI